MLLSAIGAYDFLLVRQFLFIYYRRQSDLYLPSHDKQLQVNPISNKIELLSQQDQFTEKIKLRWQSKRITTGVRPISRQRRKIRGSSKEVHKKNSLCYSDQFPLCMYVCSYICMYGSKVTNTKQPRYFPHLLLYKFLNFKSDTFQNKISESIISWHSHFCRF